MALAELLELGAVMVFALQGGAEIGLEHRPQPLGVQHAPDDLAKHDVIKLAHRHAQACATGCPLLETA